MAALATDEKERETELFHRGEQQAHAHSPQQPMESSMDSDMPNSPESSSQRCRYPKRILLFFNFHVCSPSWVNKDKDRSGITNGERFICYM